MKFIELTKGYRAKVSDRDFARVNAISWSAQKTKRASGNAKVYAQAGIGHPRRTVFMHCYIMGFKGIDHRDGDGLNNQRRNLRKATPEENGRNRVIQKHSSRFKGVTFWNGPKKWVATIQYKARIHLGYFESEIEAAKAYDAAARKLFGKFALTNRKMLGGYHQI